MGTWINKRHSDKINPHDATKKIRQHAPKNTRLTVTAVTSARNRIKGVTITAHNGRNLTPYFHALTISILEHGTLLAPPLQRHNMIPWLTAILAKTGKHCYGENTPWNLTIDPAIPGSPITSPRQGN